VLQITFDAGLRLVLAQSIEMRAAPQGESLFSRTVAADAVDMHPRLQHVGAEDDGIGLVGGHRGHDVRVAPLPRERLRREPIAGGYGTGWPWGLAGCRRVEIKEADFINARSKW
jgi:hypothetical protein